MLKRSLSPIVYEEINKDKVDMKFFSYLNSFPMPMIILLEMFLFSSNSDSFMYWKQKITATRYEMTINAENAEAICNWSTPLN